MFVPCDLKGLGPMGCQIRQNYCYTIIRHYSLVIRHCLVIIRHDYSLLGIPLHLGSLKVN